MKVRVLSSKQDSSFLSRIIGQVFKRPAQALKVARREIPYWQERGWQQSGNTFRGTYKTPYGSFLGQIEQIRLGNFRLNIFDPPEELRQHGHWTCFQPRLSGGYRIHMAHMPRDVSSAILAIERILTEAFEGR